MDELNRQAGSQNRAASAIPSSSEDLAARPPVKATLRLASLGLDGTRPTPREETGRREWQKKNGQ
jgi:hypothetical protein